VFEYSLSDLCGLWTQLASALRVNICRIHTGAERGQVRALLPTSLPNRIPHPPISHRDNGARDYYDD